MSFTRAASIRRSLSEYGGDGEVASERIAFDTPGFMPRLRRSASPPDLPVVGPRLDDSGPTSRRRVYTSAEVRSQRHLVEQMMLQGLSARTIHTTVNRANANTPLTGVTLQRIQKLYDQVEAQWVEEEEKSRPQNKMRQIRRIMDAIQLAKNGRKDANGAWVHKPSLTMVARLEELLARIQGTMAPVEMKVDVFVSHAVQHVIADLTADEVQEALSTYENKLRLAEEYEAMLRSGKVLTAADGQQVLPRVEDDAAPPNPGLEPT